MAQPLSAAQGLSLVLDDAAWRVAWGEPDWLGPVRVAAFIQVGQTPRVVATMTGQDDVGPYQGLEIAPPDPRLRASVRAYADLPLLVFRLEARVDLRGVATGTLAQTCATWPWLLPTQRRTGGVPAGTRTYGHQYTEFALPVAGDACAGGFTGAGHRPFVVEPLLFIAPDGRSLLLAPLDHFHDQVIGAPATPEAVAEGLRCGWHGDLDEIPAGFATDFAIWGADSPRAALSTWAQTLLRRAGTRRRGRYADDGVGKLSYWTDNGAAYYYRTAPDLDITTTLETALASLHADDIPVRSVQVDSWFYPHEVLRAVGPEGAPVVPPTGMMRWEPRQDLFPEGFASLRRRLAGLPLTFHSRHVSRHSPYVAEYDCWVDAEYAHPKEPRFFARLMEQAAAWGAITYEQDWMVESFVGVRGLRAAPGRARAWQETLDRCAGNAGLTLQWCMSTPADFMQSTTLHNLTSIRTSGDYRYLFDNGLNWVWFLHGNALARAFDLVPYKDVYVTNGSTPEGGVEPYAEVESLLASLSAGPVGIGDAIGCTHRELVMRSCREDGVLIKPDVPIAAIDRCFAGNAYLEAKPLIGECYSDHPAGRWWYVASFNAWSGKQNLAFDVGLGDLGEGASTGSVIAFDWRHRTWQRLDAGARWPVELGWQEWDYRVLCPWFAPGLTLFGDVGKWATVGDRRLAAIRSVPGGLAFDVVGVPGSTVEVWGLSEKRPRGVTTWDASGLWRLQVSLGGASMVSCEVVVD